MSITEDRNEQILNQELIGRADVNDIEGILAIANTDLDAVEHVVKNNADTLFTWDYTLARPALRKLYEKAKTGQWNGTTDLPWDTDVDVEKTIAADQAALGSGMDPTLYGDTPLAKWGEKEWIEFGIEGRRWQLSQFLHGEQGALLCTAKIVETVPWYDAKLYAATQVVDEARHVEVFARYLEEKLGGEYQINAHLRLLLDDIINDSRWDMTYLGMQIMVEGLALAAFGVLSLQEAYAEMSDAEMKERQEFAFEASVRMRDRFMQQEVWDRMGINPKQMVPLILADPTRTMFQQMLFSKIVPNCKKLGLLDRNDKWLRHRFEDLGVIQFEDWADTGEEFTAFELGKEVPAPGQN